jgi:hypothetical protein
VVARASTGTATSAATSLPVKVSGSSMKSIDSGNCSGVLTEDGEPTRPGIANCVAANTCSSPMVTTITTSLGARSKRQCRRASVIPPATRLSPMPQATQAP